MNIEDNKKYNEFQPCGCSRASIYDLAELLAEKLESSRRIESIVKLLGGKIERVKCKDPQEFLEKAIYSLIVNNSGDFNIKMPPWRHTELDRFTIAHELGHYFLHSRSGEFPIKAVRYAKDDDRTEWEANWFASAFLMPKREFTKIYNISKKDISTIAMKFLVTHNMVNTRIKSLKLN